MNTETQTTNTEKPQLTTDERVARRERYQKLRAALVGATGLKATLLNAAISHARGKIHARTYGLYSAGWRWIHPTAETREIARTRLTPKLLRAYGDSAITYYCNAAINNLADQSAFLSAKLSSIEALRRAGAPESAMLLSDELCILIRMVVAVQPC